MRFSILVALIAGAQAVKIDQEYAIWKSTPPPPKIWSVVKRGAHDFQDENVERAMLANPDNAGAWPIPQVEVIGPEAPPPAPLWWEKQDWERVVKKGNSGYSDDMVELALQKKPEPIMIAGQSASKPKGPPTPAEP